MRTKVLGCSVCKQEAGGLAVCLLCCCRGGLYWLYILCVLCGVEHELVWTAILSFLCCVFLCWAVRALRVVKKKSVACWFVQ